jgi:outer membrane biosynthesis protein TonB
VALGTSAVVHVLIILLIVFGVPISSASAPAAAPNNPVIQPIAMQPPAVRPKPAPRQPVQPRQPQPPPPPPPPLKEVELGPDSKKPDAPAKEAAAKAPEPTPAPPPPPAEPPKPTPEPAAPQRLLIPRPGDYTGVGALPLPTSSAWGPPKLDSASGAPASTPATADSRPLGRTGLSNTAQKWTNSFDDETSGRCVEVPDLGKNPDGTPVLATVIGRVLDTDGRTPLAGAHLQIMGTQFGTFSDSRGEYRLEFDPKLLARCRKQYVNVVAPGYANQMLTLMIGARVRSDDVVLRHH